ncbi:hypothetical protein [Rhizorhabdus wittichii]|uniref:hypothetical protein n=1 Tax=Rhizorhabdus wittichii TaxID=160791 RepID=UPI0012FE6B66|nr:hypothetical protein [Rhizorhabdus wittichii]
MAVFDEEAASNRCSRMWRKLGGLYERAAYEAVEQGLMHRALDAARRAEVCFWQATGSMDFILMKEVAPASEEKPA